MTQITPSEIKLIYIQLVLMGIIGVFLFMYALQPVSQNVGITDYAQNQSTVSSKDASWLTGLTSQDAGLGSLLPNGIGELLIITSIILIPLTIMNAFTAIRYIKDISTQWL